MAIVDKDLAGDDLLGSYSPTPLFAGDAEVVTEEGVVLSGQGVLPKYTVMGRVTATGKLKQLNAAASDGTQVACCILTQAVDTTSADVRVGVYNAGFFNDAALNWPAGVAYDTLIERQAFFARTPIRIGTVRL